MATYTYTGQIGTSSSIRGSAEAVVNQGSQLFKREVIEAKDVGSGIGSGAVLSHDDKFEAA